MTEGTHVAPKCLQVSLVLIDEVHLLNESRGPSLESGVVSRIKMIGALPSMREVTHSPLEGKRRYSCHETQVSVPTSSKVCTIVEGMS